MRRAILAGLLAAGVPAWSGVVASAAAAEAGMRASKPEVRKEVAAVIEAQLAALRKGDVAKAHSFASAELRAQKPVAVFAQIVQTSYPEIWANTRAQAGIVRDDGAQAAVTVQVYSKIGDAAYDYTLVKESVGWRISGVLRYEPKKNGGKI